MKFVSLWGSPTRGEYTHCPAQILLSQYPCIMCRDLIFCAYKQKAKYVYIIKSFFISSIFTFVNLYMIN